MKITLSTIAGFMLGALAIAGLGSLHSEVMQKQALSCMSAGNTVAQCEDILGITK